MLTFHINDKHQLQLFLLHLIEVNHAVGRIVIFPPPIRPVKKPLNHTIHNDNKQEQMKEYVVHKEGSANTDEGKKTNKGKWKILRTNIHTNIIKGEMT